jgi:predicted transcriptional regulator of viral defense system
MYLYTISSVSTKATIPFRKKLPSVFTYTEAIARGLSAERLYGYRDQGIVEQISRGLYRWADAPEIDQNLLEVAYRIPEGTLCLTTALARHGLTDNIPTRIDVAIPRGNRIPTLLSPVDVRVFSKDTFDLGRGELKVGEGFTVGLYSPERSLVDMIRLRHREGSDIAWEALRRWLGRKGAKPAALIDMAKSLHGAERAVRNALEIVL